MRNYFLLIISIFVFTACFEEEKKDINIGFVAGLTGKYSSLGTDVRDGFLLAFDEIDYKINDTKINIIAKDDKQDINSAKNAIDELIAKDIKLIVGNSTSSMTKVSIPLLKDHKDTLLISPNASSSEFGGIDDNFLRVQVELSKKRYKDFVKYLLDKDIKNIVFIYDSKNSTYVKNYEKNFQSIFMEYGGNKFLKTMDINENYSEILKDIDTKKTDLILIVANSFDSSKLVQFLRINGIENKISCAAWAKTPDFIENGGKAVEGVLFNTAYDDNSKEKKFLAFVSSYEKRYGVKPSVFAAQSYELAKILILELEKKTTLENLKKRILNTKQYQGLQGEIIFDKFGDVSRDYFLMEVRDGEFKRVK